MSTRSNFILVLLLVAPMLVLSATPRFKWGEDKEKVYVTFEVRRVQDAKVDISESGIKFSSKSGETGSVFEANLPLYKGVDAAGSKWRVDPRKAYVEVTLQKDKAGMWKNLLTSEGRTQYKNFITIDWDKQLENVKDDDEADMMAQYGMGEGMPMPERDEDDEDEDDAPPTPPPSDVDDGDVVVATGDNFEDVLSSANVVMVEFYAPWCGHCKSLAPEYATAASELKSMDTPVALAKVDATVHQELAEKYEVQGYPTLLVFRGLSKGKPQKYEGARTADAIVEFMNKALEPAVKELSSASEANAHLKNEDVAVLAVFDELEGEIYESLLLTAPMYSSTAPFGVVKGAAGLDVAVEKTPALIVSRAADEYTNVLYELDTVGSIPSFVDANRFPFVSEISQENYNDFHERGLPLCWLFINDTLGEEHQVEAVNTFREAVKSSPDLASKLSFVYINNAAMAEHIVPAATLPLVAIQVEESQRNYVMPGDLNPENIAKFAQDFLDGKAEAFIKSEEIPETNDEPVKVAVAKNWEDLVVNNDKDVLVEFYAPWCGHCKKLAPILDKAAKKLESVQSVMIVKMDATANTVPEGFKVEGFPTMYFLKGDDKQNPILFEADRSYKNILRYIYRNAATKFSLKKSKEEL